MTNKDHKDLLSVLRSTHTRLGGSTQLPTISETRTSKPFSSLEGYRRVALARSAADALGLRSPFFRSIESIEGTGASIGNASVVNFASYDYLSLNTNEELGTVVANAAAKWGISSTASRLVGGQRTFHTELESKLAQFLGAEDAITYVSGYLANSSTIRVLVQRGDLVLVDARAHNSIYEGIRGSGAEHVSFPHNDWAWVSQYLEEHRNQFENVLIIVEGLYSMDGDAPDLKKFVDVKTQQGAWLMVDEAHSVGVLGATGRGIREEQGVDSTDIDVTMGTLSKTFCACGGFVSGSRELVDLLRHTSPGFVYSVGMPAPIAAGAAWALEELAAKPEKVKRLRELSEKFQVFAGKLELDLGDSGPFAIQPVIIGDSVRATWISNKLLEKGFNVLPIIAPAVPDQLARLRFFLNAGHTEDDIESVLKHTAELIQASFERFSANGSGQ